MVMSSTYRSFFVTFRQPSDDDRDVFSAQLAPESWLAVAATVVALQVVMAAFASTNKTKRKNPGKDEMENGFGKLDRLTWTWTALAQAGVVKYIFFSRDMLQSCIRQATTPRPTAGACVPSSSSASSSPS